MHKDNYRRQKVSGRCAIFLSVITKASAVTQFNWLILNITQTWLHSDCNLHIFLVIRTGALLFLVIKTFKKKHRIKEKY